MDLSPFDFELPEQQIALRPVEPRSAARLLVVHGDGRLVDAHIRDLPELLPAGSMLVFNDTRVLPAALSAIRPARDANGRDVEVSINLVEPVEAGRWKALARPGKRLNVGDQLAIGADFSARSSSVSGNGITDVIRSSLPSGNMFTKALPRDCGEPIGNRQTFSL